MNNSIETGCYLIRKIIFLSFISLFLQITDDNYVEFLAGWQAVNKPSVLLFDQMPHVPLIYKVSNIHRPTCTHNSSTYYI